MRCSSLFFSFNDPATTDIYTLSLHDALPISGLLLPAGEHGPGLVQGQELAAEQQAVDVRRSEEHTSELQSLTNLVCRLLLEKEKKTKTQQARKMTSSEVGSKMTMPATRCTDG